jgi:hypothetical protein
MEMMAMPTMSERQNVGDMLSNLLLNFSFYLARFGEDVGCLAAVSLLNH